MLLALAQNARAFTYADEDLLLVFRKDGFNDVTYNLGNISKYLDKPDGTTIPVTGFDISVAKAQYDLTDGVKFILLGSSSASAAAKKSWLLCSDDAITPLDRTGSQWQSLWSQISAVGLRAQEFTKTNDTKVLVIEPGSLYAYTYIESKAGTALATIDRLGGTSTFPVEGNVPGKFRFFEVKTSTANPKPAAKLVGSFEISAEGDLTFRAGAGVVLPPIEKVTASIERSAENVVISFSPQAQTSYRVHASDSVLGLASEWAVVAGAVEGANGNLKTFTIPASAVRQFFSVEAYR